MKDIRTWTPSFPGCCPMRPKNTYNRKKFKKGIPDDGK